MRGYLNIFLKGLAMGVAEIIPGISGGTVALILGIYYRLIKALSEFNLGFLIKIKSGEYQNAFKQIDLYFLLTMAFGMMSSVFLLSNLIIYLLSFYPVFFKSFLSSLLFFSLFINPIKPKEINKNLFLGLVISASIAFILYATPSFNPSEIGLVYLFLCGCIAICALVLPGISGSFILLLLGVYPTVVNAVSNFEIATLSVFIGGCAVGLFSSVRVIRRFYERKEDLLLSIFFGLILFTIPIIWKQDAFEINFPQFSESLLPILGGLLLGFMLIFALNKSRE